MLVEEVQANPATAYATSRPAIPAEAFNSSSKELKSTVYCALVSRGVLLLILKKFLFRCYPSRAASFELLSPRPLSPFGHHYPSRMREIGHAQALAPNPNSTFPNNEGVASVDILAEESIVMSETYAFIQAISIHITKTSWSQDSNNILL